jgi:hypothetical protein
MTLLRANDGLVGKINHINGVWMRFVKMHRHDGSNRHAYRPQQGRAGA